MPKNIINKIISLDSISSVNRRWHLYKENYFQFTSTKKRQKRKYWTKKVHI